MAWSCRIHFKYLFEMANVDTMPEQINANLKQLTIYILNSAYCLRIALTSSYCETSSVVIIYLAIVNNRASRVHPARYCLFSTLATR